MITFLLIVVVLALLFGGQNLLAAGIVAGRAIYGIAVGAIVIGLVVWGGSYAYQGIARGMESDAPKQIFVLVLIAIPIVYLIIGVILSVKKAERETEEQLKKLRENNSDNLF